MKILKIGFIVLFSFLVVTFVQAFEINNQNQDNVFFGIYKKPYIDKSEIPHQRVVVYIKVLFKPIPGFAHNQGIANYFFKVFDQEMIKRAWRPSDYFNDYDRFYSFDDWLAWANNLDVDIEIEPDIGMNLQLDNNLVIRSYVYLCDINPFWNMLKYRAGGHFVKSKDEQKKFWFTKRRKMGDYFQKVIKKFSNCASEQFLNLDEIK